MHGDDVARAITLLNRGGYDAGRNDHVYGPNVGSATVRAKRKFGYPDKDCTPVYGQILDNLLTGVSKPSLAMRARAKARERAAADAHEHADKVYLKAMSQIGVHESPAGSNITVFSRWYGIIGAWCAMFISWCVWASGFPTGKFHYAYVPFVVGDATANRNGLHRVSGPVDGKLIAACYDWQHDGTSDHIGLAMTDFTLKRLSSARHAAAVNQWGALGVGELWAVEGNTSPSNDSNGGEVWIRKRRFADVQAFVQIPV